MRVRIPSPGPCYNGFMEAVVFVVAAFIVVGLVGYAIFNAIYAKKRKDIK